MAVVIAHRSLAEAPGAELYATSEAAGLGVRALLTPQIADVWRSGAWGGTINHFFDFGVVRQGIRLIAFAAPRDGVLPSAEAQWRIIGSAVSNQGTGALDTGLMPIVMPRGVLAFMPAAPFAARYVRVSFVAGPSDSYLQLGRAWISEALVTRGAVAYGWARGAGDTGASERAARSGVRYASRGAIYRTRTLSLPNLRVDEAVALEEIRLAAGNTGQLFVSPFDTQLATEGMFGRLTEPLASEQSSHLRHRATLTIEEDL